ncbi:MAG: 4Fe-4S binding protein, partial [Planctomycetes bacterium]|nr:4Fe-4S binding protein [Planctomycetota bacterium]
GGMGRGMGRGMGGGMGGGMGRGMGGGMGRGMGRGMGGGAGSSGGWGQTMGPAPEIMPGRQMPSAPVPPSGAISPEQELQQLRQQAEMLRRQLDSVNASIEQPQRAGQQAPPAIVAQVDAEKCTGCRACADVCPTGAISVADVAEVDVERCTACGLCVVQCPQGAISLIKA